MNDRVEPLGKVWLVGAGPGAPDLITQRGARLLGEAEVVLYDALSHPDLLNLCPQAEQIDVGKRYGKRATAQNVITDKLLELARAGKKVVRLKGGDPLMFARGSEEALALSSAGIPFEIVPGVTSPMAAAAFAGLSLTHRDLSSSVTFITGSDQTGKEWSPDAWKKLATATGTICVLMGMRRIEEIAQAIMDGGRSPDTPACVVRWAGRPQQRTVQSTLSNIAAAARAAQITSPAIIIVGDVVALRSEMNWYEEKPLFSKKILVARPSHQARETAAAIRRRGAEPVVHAAIEIEEPEDPAALDAALLRASTYDWVLFTSANGVDAAFNALTRLGRDARVFGLAKVGVIGPRTGAALEARGVKADLTARRFVAEGLVEDLLAQPDKMGRVLLLRAKEARDVLPQSLSAAGITVDVVPAYQTRKVQVVDELVLAVKDKVDAVLLTSSSMVDSLVSALGAEYKELLSQVTLVCIGPITAATVREHGLSVNVEASEFTIEGALDAYEQSLAG